MFSLRHCGHIKTVIRIECRMRRFMWHDITVIKMIKVNTFDSFGRIYDIKSSWKYNEWRMRYRILPVYVKCVRLTPIPFLKLCAYVCVRMINFTALISLQTRLVFTILRIMCSVQLNSLMLSCADFLLFATSTGYEIHLLQPHSFSWHCQFSSRFVSFEFDCRVPLSRIHRLRWI